MALLSAAALTEDSTSIFETMILSWAKAELLSAITLTPAARAIFFIFVSISFSFDLLSLRREFPAAKFLIKEPQDRPSGSLGRRAKGHRHVKIGGQTPTAPYRPIDINGLAASDHSNVIPRFFIGGTPRIS